MSKIIVSCAGWCEADPDHVKFQLSTKAEGPELITGKEWLKLPEYHEQELCRDDYILESVASTFVTALDGEYHDVEIEVEE